MLIATEAIGVGGVDAVIRSGVINSHGFKEGHIVSSEAAFQKSLSFATFSADTVPAAERRAVRTAQFAAASHGELELVVHEVLPLEQAVLAHQKMEAGEVFGRIVLVPRVERP